MLCAAYLYERAVDAVMVVLPAPLIVTLPAESIVATAELLDLYVTLPSELVVYLLVKGASDDYFVMEVDENELVGVLSAYT